MAQKGALHIADMLVKQYGARLAGSAATPAAPAAAQPAATTVTTDTKAAK
jgi:Rod binding domain-containing protein